MVPERTADLNVLPVLLLSGPEDVALDPSDILEAEEPLDEVVMLEAIELDEDTTRLSLPVPGSQLISYGRLAGPELLKQLEAPEAGGPSVKVTAAHFAKVSLHVWSLETGGFIRW